MWGEPLDRFRPDFIFAISTHSPRVGRTKRTITATIPLFNFNSLAPCGANLHGSRGGNQRNEFQLTRPVWGEPDSMIVPLRLFVISTHSPRVGRTDKYDHGTKEDRQFQLTRPVWGEPAYKLDDLFYNQFQLTRPVWGEPTMRNKTLDIAYISTHSPRVGRTRIFCIIENILQNFNSLAPCGANLLNNQILM